MTVVAKAMRPCQPSHTPGHYTGPPFAPARLISFNSADFTWLHSVPFALVCFITNIIFFNHIKSAVRSWLTAYGMAVDKAQVWETHMTKRTTMTTHFTTLKSPTMILPMLAKAHSATANATMMGLAVK
jgi:hypothetical protein